jgi:hypothetical protein
MGKTIRLHKKVKPVYKYGINEQVSLLDRKIKVGDLLTHLADNAISRTEFYSDRNIPYGSEKSIPSDRLLKYAQVFDCSVEELLNEEIKATSIRNRAYNKPKQPKTTLR